MEAEKVKINAKIAEGVTAEFESTDDLFIFLCTMLPFHQVSKTYEEVKAEKFTTRQFHKFKAQTQRFSDILTTVQCSDGTSLLDQVKRKVNL